MMVTNYFNKSNKNVYYKKRFQFLYLLLIKFFYQVRNTKDIFLGLLTGKRLSAQLKCTLLKLVNLEFFKNLDS